MRKLFIFWKTFFFSFLVRFFFILCLYTYININSRKRWDGCVMRNAHPYGTFITRKYLIYKGKNAKTERNAAINSVFGLFNWQIDFVVFFFCRFLSFSLSLCVFGCQVFASLKIQFELIYIDMSADRDFHCKNDVVLMYTNFRKRIFFSHGNLIEFIC